MNTTPAMAGMPADFSDLKAVYFNGTLKRSPEKSNTQGLIEVSRRIMEKHGVSTRVIRTVDHDIASGVYPDMREHGWATDEWPELYPAVREADIVVLLVDHTAFKAVGMDQLEGKIVIDTRGLWNELLNR